MHVPKVITQVACARDGGFVAGVGQSFTRWTYDSWQRVHMMNLVSEKIS